MKDKGFKLSDLLISLRDNLAEAEKDSEEKKLPKSIAFKEAEIEIKSIVSREVDGSLSFYVVGADYKGQKENISSIKVTLEPRPGGRIFFDNQVLAPHMLKGLVDITEKDVEKYKQDELMEQGDRKKEDALEAKDIAGLTTNLAHYYRILYELRNGKVIPKSEFEKKDLERIDELKSFGMVREAQMIGEGEAVEITSKGLMVLDQYEFETIESVYKGDVVRLKWKIRKK